MLNIGIIGLGPDWESQYRPALARLSRRLRVTAVFDPVASRAERAAQDLGAKSVLSMRALHKRPDIRAVLLLDEAWHGLTPLRFAVDSGKPMYVAGRLSASIDALDALCRDAAGQSLVVCPGLPLRSAPATARIMELTATRLGSIDNAEVRVNVTSPENAIPWIVTVIDACGVLARSIPATVAVVATGNRELSLRLTFGRVAGGGDPVQALITLVHNPATEGVFATYACRSGTILQFAEVGLRWRSWAGEEGDELLNRERPGVEVLLDHFARRVVGGLVPIPGLDDACRILRLLEPHRDAIARFGM